jgi:membrane dipeptidase
LVPRSLQSGWSLKAVAERNHSAGIVEFNDESEAPNVTRELVRRGYSEEQIRKIWGGDFLRVFREVETVADRK